MKERVSSKDARSILSQGHTCGPQVTDKPDRLECRLKVMEQDPIFL